MEHLKRVADRVQERLIAQQRARKYKIDTYS
jgi:hypothetical protein